MPISQNHYQRKQLQFLKMIDYVLYQHLVVQHFKLFFYAVDSFLTLTSCLPHLFFIVLCETNGSVLMSAQFCLHHMYLFQSRLELIRILSKEKTKDVVQQSWDDVIKYLVSFQKVCFQSLSTTFLITSESVLYCYLV